MVLPKQNKKTKLILVSGPAGAGRTTAIRSLEDLGFEAIDNLPLDLVQSVLKPEKTSENIAIGLDTRGRDFSVEGLLDLLKVCLLYTSPSPRDQRGSRMPSSA